jgi:membrane-bound lytic murein transglycosylase D
MFRKNVLRKKLFGHGLLLLIPVATLHNTIGYSTPVITGSAIVNHSLHDTTKTVSPDSTSIKRLPVATIALNKHAMRVAKAYVRKEEEYLQKMKGKSASYFETIESVFDQYNLPPQLKYLAVVESALRSTATSKAGARGLWQFMPVTAKELGLRVSGKNDERTHAYRSTVAAAKYLRSLYAEFGDWLLVLAAYNSGPGAVLGAMKKTGSKNFWALQSSLPAESREHVKHFIGVHYFFEGQGSIATQTKAEAKAYLEKSCAGVSPL